jgi:hypothetical protein
MIGSADSNACAEGRKEKWVSIFVGCIQYWVTSWLPREPCFPSEVRRRLIKPNTFLVR